MTTTGYYKDRFEELKEDIIYEITENNPIDFDDLDTDSFDYILEEEEITLTDEERMEIFTEIENHLYLKWLDDEREKEREEMSEGEKFFILQVNFGRWKAKHNLVS